MLSFILPEGNRDLTCSRLLILGWESNPDLSLTFLLCTALHAIPIAPPRIKRLYGEATWQASQMSSHQPSAPME